MIGYKLTEQQKDLLEGREVQSNWAFGPVMDINKVWFIFQQEVDATTAEDLQWVKELPQVEYQRPLESIDEFGVITLTYNN
jgi:hypothetical protein